MILTIQLRGDKRLIAKYERIQASVARALTLKVERLTMLLEAKVKTQKLNGQVLNRITGRLMASINREVKVQSNAVHGRVFSSGDVKYAAIHEFGGQTAPHLILPKKASVLRFTGKSGQTVFARKVNHPGSKMPERSFLRSSLTEMSEQISREMKEAVLQGIREA